MRRKNYKGRCEKRKLSKCMDVVRTYDEIQYAYADMLERNKAIRKNIANPDELLDEVMFFGEKRGWTLDKHSALGLCVKWSRMLAGNKCRCTLSDNFRLSR